MIIKPNFNFLPASPTFAGLEIKVASGDPKVVFDIGGTDKFILGVDDDDSDKFLICGGGTMGTNPRIAVLSDGKIGLGMAAPEVGLQSALRMYVKEAGDSAMLAWGQNGTGAWGGILAGTAGIHYLIQDGKWFQLSHADPGDDPTSASFTTPVNRLRIASNGKVSVGGKAGADSTFHIYDNSVGTTGVGLRIEQFGTGDAIIQFSRGSASHWWVGIDQSEGDMFRISSGSTLSNNDRLDLDRNGNVGMGCKVFGTNAVRVFGIWNSTAPTTSPADRFQMYSADQAGGNACLHTRTENGKVIKLYQQAHIIDADGQLADITTKFNALLVVMENLGFLATA